MHQEAKITVTITFIADSACSYTQIYKENPKKRALLREGKRAQGMEEEPRNALLRHALEYLLDNFNSFVNSFCCYIKRGAKSYAVFTTSEYD